MIHLIWIIPIGMIIFIIASTKWRPRIPNIPHFHWGWLVPIVIVVVVVVGYYLYSSHKATAKVDKKQMKNVLVCKDEETEKWVKIPPGFYKEGGSGECVEGTPPPPPARATRTAGKHKTLYVFLPDGCITKHLSGNWERYPKGGAIKFLNSQGKVVLIDEPGTYVPSSLPAGEYKICKVSLDAWGVEIWE